MAKTFLGKGVGFPIAVDSRGDLLSAEYEESVRQSVLIILGTAKGERVMRPDFGCDIYDLVFETQSASTADKLSQAVQEALLRFESRIDVLTVEVQSSTVQSENKVVPMENGEVLLVNITYEVRATNNVFNLVYPFYLERSPG
ncbi:GPW/gp25 family protein [Nodosilinea sp. PGN35]|uniref:GPW/gp25 family protein n=1 Tax=Nodosilinea sp. PGN35 TaxID=3020489 RepID=UPI0023B2A094|nr:GPW/gp25 family protein [Nodosilinea sp. TSF1-S3]MDF0367883.1 GPW/gp25 family protein [Nodosilinea sp. TSF1-S3]